MRLAGVHRSPNRALRRRKCRGARSGRVPPLPVSRRRLLHMRKKYQFWLPLVITCATQIVHGQSFRVQCPANTITHPVAANNNSEPSYNGPTQFTPNAQGYGTPSTNVNGAIKCQQVSGGDGYATMADGTQTFMFSFGPFVGPRRHCARVAWHGGSKRLQYDLSRQSLARRSSDFGWSLGLRLLCAGKWRKRCSDISVERRRWVGERPTFRGIGLGFGSLFPQGEIGGTC